MSTISGKNIEDDGLIFALDGASRRSTLKTAQVNSTLYDPGNWQIGSGGQTGYSANGSSTEQNRLIVADDPWGRKSVTWRTTPDDVSGADGGWNSGYYPIDTNYTYRYSVWVRRYTAGTGGTFYFGMNPAPIRNDNSVSQGNPYWHCPGIASLAQDQWYLVVAHCFKQSYTGLRHPESGYWYTDGNGNLQKTDLGFCNVGSQDVRWPSGGTSANHRVYHYYTTNTASGIEFAYPRMDKVDGNEPSLYELIYKGESGWRDMVSKDVLNVENGLIYADYDKTGSFVFDGTDDYIDVPKDFGVLSAYTFEYVAQSNSGGNMPVSSRTSTAFYKYGASSWRYTHGGVAGEFYHTGGADTGWSHWVITYDGKTITVYENNISKGSVSSTGLADFTGGIRIGSWTGGASYTWDGKIPVMRMYNRALTIDEVNQNYKAYKNRFNI